MIFASFSPSSSQDNSCQTLYQQSNINIISNATRPTIATTIINIREKLLESGTKLLPLYLLVIYFPEFTIHPNKIW
jgi:hypothetical protein